MARSTYFDLGRSADACLGSESGYAQRFQCGNIVKRPIWTRMKRDILGYGRTRCFPVGSIQNLRPSGFFPSNSYWENYLVQLKLAGGTVGFNVQGQIKKFGIQLTEPEAQEVVRELKPHLS